MLTKSPAGVARRPRSRETGSHTQGAGPVGGSSLEGLQPRWGCPISERLTHSLVEMGDSPCGSFNTCLWSASPPVFWLLARAIVSGAFSKLKTHCCPFLGKKESEFSIRACGKGVSPRNEVMKPLVLVAKQIDKSMFQFFST